MYSLLGIFLYYIKYKYSQYFSNEKIIENQCKKIKKILKLCKDDLVNSVDITLSSHEFINDFTTKIPILDKKYVKRNPHKFLKRKPNKLDLEFFTSGSTGNPMKAFVSWRHWIREQAVIYRHWKWHGYKFRDTCAMLRSYSPEKGQSLIKYKWSLNTYYYSPFHLDEDTMEKYYRHMLSKRVKYLRGYPSSIKIFSQFCRKNKYSIPTLKFILTASEVLSLEDRNYIESAFGVKIGDHYGLAEQIVMFGNCNKSNLLHNYNEYGFCELIPTDQKNIYRIIGTNLNNDLMPLLRYDTGDLAFVRPGINCSCGRQGLVVEAVIGRNDVAIEDSKKNKLPTVNFYTLLHKYTCIDAWQIAISKDDIFKLLYTGIELSNDEYDELIEGLNQRLINTILKPNIFKVNALNRIAEGKIPRIYYEK